jgi:DNA-binding FrmR family transcriptional regulator
MENKSEVARIMAQIEAMNQSLNQALKGLSEGTARHAFITARLERVQGFHEVLKPVVGKQKATEIICEVLEGMEYADDE